MQNKKLGMPKKKKKIEEQKSEPVTNCDNHQFAVTNCDLQFCENGFKETAIEINNGSM